MTPEIQSCLDNLLEMNEEKYQNFRSHRIDICNAAIMATIKNKFTDPADVKDLNTQNTRKRKVSYGFLSFPYRDSIVTECFQCKVTVFPSSLIDGGKMYKYKELL